MTAAIRLAASNGASRPSASKKAPSEKLSPELVYRRHIGQCPDIATDGVAMLYRWDGCAWRALSHDECLTGAHAWLDTHFPEKASPRLAESCVKAAIFSDLTQRLPAAAKDTIPLENGYLKIDASGQTIAIMPPDKSAGLTYRLSCRYDLDARAPTFEKFLREILPDPAVREWLQCFVGYTLISDCRYQVAALFLGSGANGKSTLCEIVEALHHKTATMALDSLRGFSLSQIIGASLVIVEEVPRRIDEQQLKILISGGLISIDRKYRDPISVRPTAKWIICANELPALTDHSHGLWRRLAVVPFEQKIPKKHQDPELAKRIIKTELSGVFSWALGGLIKTLRDGGLPPIPEKMAAAIEQGRRQTDSVSSWVADDQIEYAESAWVDRAHVYAAYATWAKSMGNVPVNHEKFWVRMHDIDPRIAEPVAKKIAGQKRRGARCVLKGPAQAE